MKEHEIIKFLIETMTIQIVDEYKTTDHKDYIKKCIEAKKWLYEQMYGKDDFLGVLDCANDSDEYLKED